MKKGEQISANIKSVSRKSSMVRNQVVTFSLNDPEYKTLEKYCKKYKITNRARFIRESLMKTMLIRMSEDYPTLFGENEMR